MLKPLDYIFLKRFKQKSIQNECGIMIAINWMHIEIQKEI